MKTVSCSALLLFFLYAIFTPLPLTNAIHFFSICEKTVNNYTANSTFSKNLNLTLSSLVANASTSNGFYTTSTGNNPDIAYGLFLCRGDISRENCQSCITNSSKDVIEKCPNKKESITWYDECMIRYSNRSIFARMEENPGVYGCDPNVNVSNPDLVKFNENLGRLMSSLVKGAVNGSSQKMFATGDVSYNSTNKIYGLAQCTPDISKSDCQICLSKTAEEIKKVCDRKQGARLLKPSCYVRYESGLFYEPAAGPSPSPSPSPASSPRSSTSLSPSPSPASSPPPETSESPPPASSTPPPATTANPPPTSSPSPPSPANPTSPTGNAPGRIAITAVPTLLCILLIYVFQVFH